MTGDRTWFKVTDSMFLNFENVKGQFYWVYGILPNTDSSSGESVIYTDGKGAVQVMCTSLVTFYSDAEMLLE